MQQYLNLKLKSEIGFDIRSTRWRKFWSAAIFLAVWLSGVNIKEKHYKSFASFRIISCYRRITKIPWTLILAAVKKDRELIKLMEIRKLKYFGHLIKILLVKNSSGGKNRRPPKNWKREIVPSSVCIKNWTRLKIQSV